ncbi:MAG: hypothetical protein AMS22_07790 [Thiotrichales bacterium SG8_50]|nr:MAG: hypothetical protein AMS22_07790 [Thiotrichales bacterium SG8_50]
MHLHQLSQESNMRGKKWAFSVLIFFVFGVTALGLQCDGSSSWFAEYPLPLREDHKLFDVGVVDVNGDKLLDIYTSNHNFRQALLIADGNGGYRDMIDEWGLGHSQEFPGVELSFVAPKVDKAGLYIYWLGVGGNEELGHHVIIHAHKTSELGEWRGDLRINAPVDVHENDGFDIDIEPQSFPRSETTVRFSTSQDAMLKLKLTAWGLPINFDIQGAMAPDQIYVGNRKKTPHSTRFTIALQDRHGLAWADYNDDGRMDVFTNRGALSGTLMHYPENVQRSVKDVFFVSEQQGTYKEIGEEVGIAKRGCSGRHIKWVDYNQDGLLDLYVNCQDRGRVEREFPNQLYRQSSDRQFVDVAAEVGLTITDHQVIDFAWLDADADGDPDLLTTTDKGFFLYRNQAGRFSQEFMGRGRFAREDKPGLRYVTLDYWNFDGKLTVADYDADGDLDAFSVSKQGSTLLVNDQGKYTALDPVSVGLPAEGVGGNWVDYDNDGLTDFHAVPEGLFRQLPNHKFEATNLLALPSHLYLAAISNWADLDNDGTRDVVIAVNENPSLWRWWEKPFKSPMDIFKWEILSYRNKGADNHWLQFLLEGHSGNREAIGAQVTVVTPRGQQVMEVGSSEGSFFSHGHYRLYFGLGEHETADTVRIRWPDGRVQEMHSVPGDKLLTLKQKTLPHSERQPSGSGDRDK